MQVPIPTRPAISYVTLGKFLNFSDPQFPKGKHWDSNPYIQSCGENHDVTDAAPGTAPRMCQMLSCRQELTVEAGMVFQFLPHCEHFVLINI